MEALLSLLVSIVLFVCGAGFGRTLTRLLGDVGKSPVGRLVWTTSVGLGTMSLLIFAVGVCGLFRAPWLWVLWCAFAAVAAAGLREAWRDFRQAAGSAARAWRDPLCRAVGVLLVLVGLAALAAALAPPAMTDWDSLAYHLAVPKLYLNHGGIYYINFTSHSNFPFLMEMLYIPGLSLGLPIAAKLVHFWMGFLLVAGVAVLAAEKYGTRAGLLAALGIAGMPIVLWEATTAYVDLAAALYTVLAVYVLLEILDKPSRHMIAACGIAAGFAASTKMTALAIIPLLGLWILLDNLFARRRVNLKSPILVMLVGLAVCSPWYIKSFVYTGNPVYPFFYEVFGGRNWTAELARSYSALQAQFGVGRDISAFLLAPYDLTFNPEMFYDTPGLFVGPLLLVALPVLFVGLRGGRGAVGLLCFAAAQYVVWFKLTQQSRYLIPVFALIALLISWAVYGNERLRASRRAVWAVFALTSLFGIWTLAPAVKHAAPFVMGFQTRDQYLRRALDIYPAQAWINGSLPVDAKVALFGDTRGFYLDRPYVWADFGHNAEFSAEFKSVKVFTQYLIRSGVSHAVVNYGFFPPPDRAERSAALLYDAIYAGDLRRVYPDGDDPSRVVVYEIVK